MRGATICIWIIAEHSPLSLSPFIVHAFCIHIYTISMRECWINVHIDLAKLRFSRLTGEKRETLSPSSEALRDTKMKIANTKGGIPRKMEQDEGKLCIFLPLSFHTKRNNASLSFSFCPQPTAVFYWQTLRSSTSRLSIATRASSRSPATIAPRYEYFIWCNRHLILFSFFLIVFTSDVVAELSRPYRDWLQSCRVYFLNNITEWCVFN